MKRRLLVSFQFAVALAVLQGCEDFGNSPREPLITEDSGLERPFSSSTYFLARLQVDPFLELERLEGSRFALRDAWIPNDDGPCMRIGEIPVLVVRLKEPDTNILALGFLRDSTAALTNCTWTWKHYRY